MRFEIKFSQRAISSFDALPKDVVKKVQRVLSFLEEGEDKLVNSSMLKGGRKLYSVPITPRYRLIYSKKNNEIVVIDFIRVDQVAKIMRSEK